MRLRRVVATGFGAVPFAFAIIRAIETGTDFRALWMALAALAGAVVGLRVARHLGPALQSAVTFVLATAAAAVAAIALGAASGLALLIVAGGFGACWAAVALLRPRSRPPSAHV